MGVIILIPNMDMPKNCETCKFSSYHDGDDYCDLYKILHGYAWRAKDVKWDDDCPLKPEDDYKPVLDKLRVEIEELDNKVCQQFLIEDVDKEVHHAYQNCLEIIDNYKAESEVNNEQMDS